MKTVCIGGGPAGLYLGILLKLTHPRHQVTVFERNRSDDTFGFGVVFSDATLGNLAAADPVSHAAVVREFARWDDIEIHVADQVFTSTGHGFCGVERNRFLQILQARARELGVALCFEHAIRSLDQVGDADLIVAADGVGSWARDARAEQFQPQIDARPNKFVWLGTTVPYRAFTFLFHATAHGLFRVHAYPYAATGSTFIVECTADTWRAAGFEFADEDRTVAILEEIFADHLRGHRLIKNRSIWRNFPTVRNRSWRAGNMVLVGDAAHTAHFSIGSGTKLAMEDAIALRDALVAEPDIETALADYEMRRRPEVESLQLAAQASLEWFEGAERYLRLPPAQFAYSLMTRSLRVSHASMVKRDPQLTRTVEALVASVAGDPDGTPPMFTTATIGGLRLANRVALAPWPVGGATDGVVGDAHLVFLGARASGGVGLLITEPVAAEAGAGGAGAAAIVTDDQLVAWRRVVEFIHQRSAAKIGLHLAGASAEALVAAAQRASFAGFDLLSIELGEGPLAELTSAALLATLGAVRAAWPAERPFGVRIRRGIDDDAEAARLAPLVPGTVDVVMVAPSASKRDRRGLDAALLADRVRNQLGVATIAEDATAAPADVDAVIAAGRCDLVALGKALVVDPGFVDRAAEAAGWHRPGADEP